ncbi:MAG: hypothetical protein V1752_00355 [Candidatus Firestonebacteria bacterium]
MKSLEDLKKFYREKLYISLLPLEKQRKKIEYGQKAKNKLED